MYDCLSFIIQELYHYLRKVFLEINESKLGDALVSWNFLNWHPQTYLTYLQISSDKLRKWIIKNLNLNGPRRQRDCPAVPE